MDNQEKLLQSLEGLGDILVFEAGRKTKNKDVIDGLDDLVGLIKKLLVLQDLNPKKFADLVYSKKQEANPENLLEAQHSTSIFPEKFLYVFSAAINQIIRIHESAIESQNQEISLRAAYKIIELIGEFSESRKNHIFVNQLLNKLNNINELAIANSDPSVYLATGDWYTSSVFNYWDTHGRDLDLFFLEIFNNYFFNTIKLLIEKNRFEPFKYIIQSLHSAIYKPFLDENIREYENILLRENKVQLYKEVSLKTINLIKFVHDLRKVEDIDKALLLFEEIQKIVLPNLTNEELITRAKQLEAQIPRDLTLSYKFKELMQIIFSSGVFCLLKGEKEQFIKYMWEFHHPPDIDFLNGGHSILPENIREVIDLYFKQDPMSRRLQFWEDNRGSDIYYKKYFILLIARLIKNGPLPGSTGDRMMDINLDGYTNSQRLADISFVIGEMEKELVNVINEPAILLKLGFKNNDIEQIFGVQIPEILEDIKIAANNRILEMEKNGKISQKKVDDFFKDFYSAYDESKSIKDMFSEMGKLEFRKLELSPNDLSGSEFPIVVNKTMFFDEWYIREPYSGKTFGKYFKTFEEGKIFEMLIKKSTKSSSDSLQDMLKNIRDLNDYFLIVSESAYFKFIATSGNFLVSNNTEINTDLSNYSYGWYKHNDTAIPIIRILFNEDVLVLADKNKIGKLIQFTPNTIIEKKFKTKDIFPADVKLFSENEDLLKKYIELRKLKDNFESRSLFVDKAVIEIKEFLAYEGDAPGILLHLKVNKTPF